MVSDLFDLSGKVAVVTGASSGLGVAFAEAMAEAGADVVCAARRENRLMEIADKIKQIGRKSLAIPTDVSKENDVKRLFLESLKVFGKLDILFNNAGISGGFSPIHETSLGEWSEVVATNLNGVFLCAREAAKEMIKQKSGKIINIASIWGLVGSAAAFFAPGYCATKGAVINLTREMALEYAPFGINVNAIAPAFYRTEILEKGSQGIEAMTPLIPMHAKYPNAVPPETIKGTAIYLASKASDWMTGHILVIDGGYTAM